MLTKTEPSVRVTVYIAGDYQTAKAALRRECFAEGLCVTVTPTCFVYTAGAEDGVAVGFVNYPRFPTTADALFSRAVLVANRLMAELCQWSALVVGPETTMWLSNRPEDTK